MRGRAQNGSAFYFESQQFGIINSQYKMCDITNPGSLVSGGDFCYLRR